MFGKFQEIFWYRIELVNPAIYLSIIDPDLRDKDFQILAEIFYTLKYVEIFRGG